MRKKFSTIILCVIFLIGLIILLYPTVSSYYNKRINSYAISEYEDIVTNLQDNEIESMLKSAEEYNADLLKKPLQFVNGDPKDHNYLSKLNVLESNMIGVIEIKKIDMHLPIYHGTSEPVLQKGVGHLEGSALPIGGVGNHSVLSGHRGLPSSKLFTNIDKLESGDIITIKVCNKIMYYKVYEINVVLPEDIELLKPEKDKDLITLVTCTPYGINSHRLLVRAERCEYVENQEVVVEDSNSTLIKQLLVAFLITITSIIIFLRGIKKYKNRTREV